MKNMFVFLTVLCFSCVPHISFSQQCPLPYSCSQSPPYPGSTEDQWEKAFCLLIKVLEKRFGVPFDTTWYPRVSFVYGQHYAAQYSQTSHSFTITHWYQAVVIPMSDSVTKETSFAASLMCHELGHALAEQISYRVTCKPWPDTMVWKYGTERQKMVQKILSEGVSEYFGNLVVRDTMDKIYWLPTKKKHCLWTPGTSEWMYHGGYWTVKPILDRFGQQGLIYVITNTTFPRKSYNLRRGALRYQRRALKKLSR